MRYVLDHVGLKVTDVRKLSDILVGLGLCTMAEDELPEECLLDFGGVGLQLHQGETSPTGVKLAIRIVDPVGFRELLEEKGIEHTRKQGHEDDPWRFDFSICGISFHTVGMKR
jgi:hypothetical protein